MKVPYPEQFDFPNLENLKNVLADKMMTKDLWKSEIKRATDLWENEMVSDKWFVNKIIKLRQIYGI